MELYITEIKSDGVVVERNVSSWISPRKLDGYTTCADNFMSKENIFEGEWAKIEDEVIPSDAGRLVVRFRYCEKDGPKRTWWEIDIIEINATL